MAGRALLAGDRACRTRAVGERMAPGSFGSVWKRWRAGVLTSVVLHCGLALGLAVRVQESHPMVAPPSFAVELVSAPVSAEPHPEAQPEQEPQSPAPIKSPIVRPRLAPSDFVTPPPAPPSPHPPAVAPPTPAPVTPPPAAAVATASVNRAATSSSLDPKAQASWESDVLARLDAAKRYPAAARFAREEAIIQVQFEVDRRGRVVACKLLRPSGVADLDDEVLSLLKRVRLPPPPLSLAEGDLKLTVPIEFSINRD